MSSAKALLIHVEGQTEETFVNEILAPHLYGHGYTSVSARLVGNARNRSRRGGIRAWPAVREDIVDHLKQFPERLSTTLVDYYALPQSGAQAWPGRAAADAVPFARKAETVELALSKDIGNALPKRIDPNQFLPFVLMHEFESLLFSDCAAFASGVGRPDLKAALQAVRDEFGSPEEINDSPLTAPSKRVEALIWGYDKPFLGPLAALEIGLESIRSACPHFASWLKRLENWAR